MRRVHCLPDQVCVDYKDLDHLKDECDDGRRLGFTGKVCSCISIVAAHAHVSLYIAASNPPFAG